MPILTADPGKFSLLLGQGQGHPSNKLQIEGGHSRKLTMVVIK